ncbi:hypothetical protein G3435_04435 [Pseudomonas sp. MAFF212428]|uniref:Uncharacterized protein n=1 Tax=Pseudomonas brassicae TaxID=2708063 RepID=A0A6B3P0U7_9PSED|nr:hypothetical protein [Pseudomonas brassicae]NER59429.1 hypothetical protein [Pseudomonas brassicae]NER65374.1 hypothetical protein [Pseudomonas brassicae]
MVATKAPYLAGGELGDVKKADAGGHHDEARTGTAQTAIGFFCDCKCIGHSTGFSVFVHIRFPVQ